MSCSAAAWLTTGEACPANGVAGGANDGVGGTRDREVIGAFSGVSTSPWSFSGDRVRLDASFSLAESDWARFEVVMSPVSPSFGRAKVPDRRL